MKAKFLVACGGCGEYLLGQRKVLGLRGELQVDVKNELDNTKIRLGDAMNDHFFQVQADAGADTVYKLVDDIGEIANEQGWDSETIKHATFIKDNHVKVVSLRDGMAQSPAIGGLAILQKPTQEQLEQAIVNLIIGIGENDLEFWIISSLAGGTGEGTHRAVAEKIIEVCRRNDFSPKIKFVRIGYATYSSCAKGRSSSTPLLALAADAIFENEMGIKFKERAAPISWYYLDFPDYGFGDAKKPIRGKVIELGCKALMMDELSKDLDRLTVNASTILCRVGYWGKEYDDNDLLAAALDGLLMKLNLFMNPDEPSLTPAGMEPIFERGDGLDTTRVRLADAEFLAGKIDEGWKIVGLSKPKRFENLDQYLNECEQSLASLLGVFSYKGLGSQYKLSIISNGSKKEVPFQSKSTASEPGNTVWFVEVNTAQSVRAWALKLLGIRWIIPPKNTRNPWFTESGLLNDLFKVHKECTAAFFGMVYKNSQVVGTQLAKKLANFATLLIQVRFLYNELMNSVRLLSESMADAKKVLDYATERKSLLSSLTGEGAPVVVAELDNVLDQFNRLTWFKLIYDEVTQKRPDEFAKEAICGAVGLTGKGLREVLGLALSASTEMVKTELRGHVGRMYLDDGTEIEAFWFGGKDPTGLKKDDFYYRMLPKLVGDDAEKLTKSDPHEKVQFEFPQLGVLGLKVLALEGVTIAPKDDVIASHAWLAAPYVSAVREELSDKEWLPAHERGNSSSRYDIATGAVIGDSLSEEVLLKAGLKPEEITRLREYLRIKTFAKETGTEKPGKK